jgi:hypothetical protein
VQVRKWKERDGLRRQWSGQSGPGEWTRLGGPASVRRAPSSSATENDVRFRWYLQRCPPSEPAGYGGKSCFPHLIPSHHMYRHYAIIPLSVPVHHVQHARSQKVREMLAASTN